MYNKRVKIFVIFAVLLLAACLLRLAQMQLLTASSVQNEIAELKRRRGQSKQLKTIRGRIVDRRGRILAVDEAQFWVHINYRLSSFLDERVQRGKHLIAANRTNPDIAVRKTDEEIRDRLEDLQQIIIKCAQFRAVEPSKISSEIQRINDFVWDRRMFQAWRRKFPNSEVFENYDNIVSIPISEAIADFRKKEADPAKQLELASKVDIAEMHESWPLLELKTDDDIFAAQLEFMDTDGVRILPKAHRFYTYGSVAAQTIGWVGPATQERDKELFANDRLLSYLGGEVCGRRPGVEYVCEAVLRGRRGELSHDIDGQLISQTDTQFGKDVSLTLDIELQQRIENYLTDYRHDPNCGPGMSIVVIDVGTGDILALVSLPLFDLNRARYDYDTLIAHPGKPLINRAINEHYPPGSVIKPFILIAALQEQKVAPREVISCPYAPAPKDWPNCMQFSRYHGCHDWKWENEGGNIARNAIRGSCNVYFSRLADRIEPLNLQQWLFKFGYGQDVPLPPASIATTAKTELSRNFHQLSGTISSGIIRGSILNFEEVPPLRKRERRWFGIGQGNLRVTPLQVANAMAAIARGGILKPPRLFEEFRNSEGTDLGISLETLAVVYDGMSAVVNEHGGTAYKQFEPFLTILAEQDVKVYGKTGSTENPEHAWFAGFAQDSTARKIAIAVVVEGGQHGSSDAAPLARDIIQFCIEAEYVGKSYFEQSEESLTMTSENVQ
ncbi:MAG: penicillin-binding transpeptidase domain-containing protein [Phycisphaerales bacterium]|jgi:penicillin-binding protein 2